MCAQSLDADARHTLEDTALRTMLGILDGRSTPDDHVRMNAALLALDPDDQGVDFDWPAHSGARDRFRALNARARVWKWARLVLALLFGLLIGGLVPPKEAHSGLGVHDRTPELSSPKTARAVS